MLMSVAEILEKASKKKTKKEKVEYLKENGNDVLQGILKCALDPNVTFILPEGTPPYKKLEENMDVEGQLYNEWKRFYLFLPGGEQACPSPVKREHLFIQILESISPKDAELLCAMKDKKLPYKGITKNVVNETFPGLIS